jgi:predicted cupin superfamily sugar epimerase
MSFLINDEPEPNYRPFILAFIIMAIAIFFALKAHAESYTDYATGEKALTPVGSQYAATKEPQVVIDRHVLNRSDYESDKSILIAGVRYTPKFEVSEPVAVSNETVVREFMPATVNVSTEDVDVVHYKYSDKGFI